MKRISLVLVILALSPVVTQAYYGGWCCVHYSPYALSYRHSGLVPGCVDYTPYALSYRNSGLVEGYGVCYSTFGFAVPAVGVRHGFVGGPRGHARTAHMSFRRFAAAGQPAADSPAPDGLNTIRQYLRDRGFATVSVNRILRIDDKLVGADFTLADQNLVIRYWDPQEIERLSSQPASVQKRYEQHRQAWEGFAEQHRQTGGAVYCVEASDPQTIVASLQACPRLDGSDRLMSRPVMYARN